jgi:DNA-binding MarR family transcriptional regulator
VAARKKALLAANQPEALLASIRLIIRLARVAQQTCEELGLSLPQYRALHFARDKRRAYELADYSDVSRPAISALTTGLERAGLLERSHTEEDGRAVYFITSQAGRDLLAQAEALLVRRFTEALGPLTPAIETFSALDSEMIMAALDTAAAITLGTPEKPAKA